MAENIVKRLPNEILISIVNCLKYERGTLLQLTLVSRTINKLATPLLYRSYQQPLAQDGESLHRFYSYLRTILRNPALALCVKHISLYTTDSNSAGPVDIGRELHGLIKSRIEFICSDWLKSYVEEDLCKIWLEWAGVPVLNSLYILLLHCLPNLETIFLQEGYKPRAFERLLAATVASCNKASMSTVPAINLPLAKLQSIRSWASEVVSSWSSFDGLGSFFRLPSVRSIEIAMARDNASGGIGGEQKWKASKRSSHVERLSFQASEINAVFMRAVIGSCIGLKEFHFTYGYNMSRGCLCYPQELLEELLEHAKTLEVLRINYDDSSRKTDWDYNAGLNTTMLKFSKDLSKLERLKHLALNHTTMFGGTIGKVKWYDGSDGGPRVVPARSSDFCLSDYLPPNLEELEIFSCGSGVLPHFQHMAEIRKQTSIFEKLRKVTFYMVDEATSDEHLVPTDMPGVEIKYLTMVPLDNSLLLKLQEIPA